MHTTALEVTMTSGIERTSRPDGITPEALARDAALVGASGPLPSDVLTNHDGEPLLSHSGELIQSRAGASADGRSVTDEG